MRDWDYRDWNMCRTIGSIIAYWYNINYGEVKQAGPAPAAPPEGAQIAIPVTLPVVVTPSKKHKNGHAYTEAEIGYIGGCAGKTHRETREAFYMKFGRRPDYKTIQKYQK